MLTTLKICTSALGLTYCVFDIITIYLFKRISNIAANIGKIIQTSQYFYKKLLKMHDEFFGKIGIVNDR